MQVFAWCLVFMLQHNFKCVCTGMHQNAAPPLRGRRRTPPCPLIPPQEAQRDHQLRGALHVQSTSPAAQQGDSLEVSACLQTCKHTGWRSRCCCIPITIHQMPAASPCAQPDPRQANQCSCLCVDTLCTPCVLPHLAPTPQLPFPLSRIELYCEPQQAVLHARRVWRQAQSVTEASASDCQPRKRPFRSPLRGVCSVAQLSPRANATVCCGLCSVCAKGFAACRGPPQLKIHPCAYQCTEHAIASAAAAHLP